MKQNLLTFLHQQNPLAKIMKTNETTQPFGLVLSEKDAELIVEGQTNALREQQRVEFGPGIAEKIIYEFCDSDFIHQSDYVETIIRLEEIFYLYKNETQDEVTDDELLHLMKEQFELLCFGDLDYLEGTCLNNFAQAIRMGYEGHKGSDGYGEYSKFDEVKRWDYDLYFEALKELCWR